MREMTIDPALAAGDGSEVSGGDAKGKCKLPTHSGH
jgi:hypothetical protein